MKLLYGLLLVLLSTFAYSQDSTTCVLHEDTLEMIRFEQEISAKKEVLTDCRTIRIVVHVIYDGFYEAGNSRAEITPEQVKSQIRITNQFFRNDSLMFNEDNTPLNYTLELAMLDPDGNPTTGINYYDGHALFGENYHLYGLRNTNSNSISATTIAQTLRWDVDTDGKKYLNCYIVNKIDGSNGGGVQAYAWLPTSSIVYGNYNLANTFGAEQLETEYNQNFNLKSYTDLGFTFTHEVAHNLSLYHVFQGNSCEPEQYPLIQGDKIEDTPPQTQGGGCYGACGFISYNVMDYLTQTCKNRITQGQVERVESAMATNLMQDYLVCQSAPCDKSPDINSDGFINLYDISLLSPSFGSQVGEPNYNEAADLNCDGVIDIYDISLISAVFNSQARILSVNELPAEITLYDLLGRVVKHPSSSGIYIMKQNGITQKVFIEN